MKKSSADYWAPRISAEWRKSVAGILAVGREVAAAKAACEHGEFLRLFKGHPQAVADPVPFGPRTAARLMKVASHPVLSDATHASHLPQSWMTLHELSILDGDVVVAGIESGAIGPEMTREHAVVLRGEVVRDAGKPPHEVIGEGVKNAVHKLIGRLTEPGQFLYVRRRLEQELAFVAEMEAKQVGVGVGRRASAG